MYHIMVPASYGKESSRANDARGRNWVSQGHIGTLSTCTCTYIRVYASKLGHTLGRCSWIPLSLSCWDIFHKILSGRIDHSLRFSCFRSVTVAYTGEDGVCERTEFESRNLGVHRGVAFHEILVYLPRN